MTVEIDRIGWNEIRRHEQAASVIQDRAAGLANELEIEAAAMRTHREFIDGFVEQMKFGSALKDHPERVLEWLIAAGWTPSNHIFLTEVDSDE